MLPQILSPKLCVHAYTINLYPPSSLKTPHSVAMSLKTNSRLYLGTNFSFEPKPQINPTNSSPNILIIGGGVTGLVTAWVLLDRGYHVTIVAKDWASYTKEQRLTSQIAGALWEYPPAVCGQHTDIVSLARSKHWCMLAYRVWEVIAADPNLSAAAGVQMKESVFFFPYQIQDNAKQLGKLHELYRSGVRGVCRDPNLIHEHNINPSFGAVDAYKHLAPIIDTDRCMTWLMELVRCKGAELITETIYGDLFLQEDDLLSRFNADAIVNATGLASLETAGDPSCYPLRGALIRLINDGKDFPKITTAMSISADAARDNEIVFLVPRNDNILVLGGVAQRDEWGLDLTLDSPVVKRMRKRCEAFIPSLKNARLDPEYPLAQGLRPGREENIRVEQETRRHKSLSGRSGSNCSRIFHSYGHGGSGWSLSFGCADEIASLIEKTLYSRKSAGVTRVSADVPKIQSRL
jgi:D-amino-acid oxidase